MKPTTQLKNYSATFVGAGMALALATTMSMVMSMSACSAPDVPNDATWAEHVKPILAAKCVHCHGFPAIQGAPDTFRLDVYDNTIDADGRVIFGAAQMAAWIQLRTDPEQSSAPNKPYGLELMPLEPESLTSEQQAILFDWGNQQKWVNFLPARGAKAGNALPVIALTQPLADSIEGGLLTIEYNLRDPDGDVAVGELQATNGAGESMRIGSLELGTRTLVWDVGAVSVGSYSLTAVIDDGSGPTDIDLGNYDVSRADGNTAPTITILSPTMDSVAGDAVQPFAINVSIADPDAADSFTMSIKAISDTAFIRIAENVTAVAGANAITWNTTGVPADNWRIEVTVSDGSVSRTRTSQHFIVSHVTSPDTFDDLSNLFLKCNACHGAPVAPDLDITSMLGRIYLRVVRQRNMPPESYRAFDDGPEDPQLTEAERDRIGQWILAGGPL